jgi:integrase/recombinase XerD
MSTWPDSDGAALRRYVKHLRLRNPVSRRVYCSILNGFQRFVAQQSPTQPVSRQIIERWLRDRATVLPFHIVTHRARLVDRFLDWLVIYGLLPSNPLAQLRQNYGPTNTTHVVRALLQADPDTALEAARPPPRFASFLGPQLRDHIALMQTMGYRYLARTDTFLRFDRFLQSHPQLVDQPLGVLVREWSAQRPTVQHAWQCLNAGRAIAKALRRHDPTIAIPAMDPRLTRQVHELRRRPYIFTQNEVRRLLDTALRLPSPKAPLRPLSAYTMLVLAYCAGLRVSEIVHLTVGDVHLEDQTIEILDTKFFKSRRLPLAPSAMDALQDYLVARQRAGAPQQASAALFWNQRVCEQRFYITVARLLALVIRQAGLKPQQGRVGPRVHDLRHSFVVNRMLAWYGEGVNPQSRLPYLATYLGHKDINSTLVYLTITQELLQQAGDRFHAFAAGALHISTGIKP